MGSSARQVWAASSGQIPRAAATGVLATGSSARGHHRTGTVVARVQWRSRRGRAGTKSSGAALAALPSSSSAVHAIVPPVAMTAEVRIATQSFASIDWVTITTQSRSPQSFGEDRVHRCSTGGGRRRGTGYRWHRSRPRSRRSGRRNRPRGAAIPHPSRERSRVFGERRPRPARRSARTVDAFDPSGHDDLCASHFACCTARLATSSPDTP